MPGLRGTPSKQHTGIQHVETRWPRGMKQCPRTQETWDQCPALSLVCCVILGKSLHLASVSPSGKDKKTDAELFYEAAGDLGRESALPSCGGTSVRCGTRRSPAFILHRLPLPPTLYGSKSKAALVLRDRAAGSCPVLAAACTGDELSGQQDTMPGTNARHRTRQSLRNRAAFPAPQPPTAFLKGRSCIITQRLQCKE